MNRSRNWLNDALGWKGKYCQTSANGREKRFDSLTYMVIT